jgi:hypothetical protein
LRNNRFVAPTSLAFIVLVGIGTLTGAPNTAWEFAESRVLGRSTALRAEYCDLLRPLMTELDRTKAVWNARKLVTSSAGMH